MKIKIAKLWWKVYKRMIHNHFLPAQHGHHTSKPNADHVKILKYMDILDSLRAKHIEISN